MWKSCLLLLVSLAALMQAEIWNKPPKKFTAGHDYVFHYDAQILTGVPAHSWHYTGYRLLAQVTLHVKEMDNILLRFTQIRFQRMNDEINVDEPNVFLPENMFENLSEERLAELIVTELQRPMRFRWNNGVVNRVEVHALDQFWSINIKKGLLNMLNMDLTTRGTEDRQTWSGAYRQSNYEEGIEGRCRSVYHWNRLPIAHLMDTQSEGQSESVPITMVKTRDGSDCLDTVGFEHALFLQNNCDEKRMNVSRNVIRAEATTQANLTYWQRSKEFFTWEIKTDARYTFAPVNAKIGSVSTFVKQNLKFLKTRNSQGATPSETTTPFSQLSQEQTEGSVEFKEEETLRMTIPIPEIMPLKNATESLNHIVLDLFNLIRAQLKEKNANVMNTIKDWVPYLRQVPKKVLQTVYQECVQRIAEEPALFNLFHDILPTVATKEALELFLESALITPTTGSEMQKHLTDMRIARRMRTFAMMNHVVYKEMITILMNAAESPALQSKNQRRETLKAVLMTIGTLANTYTNRLPTLTPTAPHEDDTEDIQTQVLNFFQRLMNKDIRNLPQQEKMIVILKAVGNSANRRSLPILSKLLFVTENVPVAVKVQCIYSMRKLAPILPEEVRRHILPIFFDVREDAELRIASYLIAMRTRPTRVILESIVESIRREPVKQVQSFVFSHLKNVAEVPCHCDCNVVKNISHIMETIEMKDSGMQYSHAHHIPLTETESAVIRTGIIYTPQEFLPRSGNMRILTQTNGRETNILEAGFRADGFQKLLSKLVGPNGKMFTMQHLEQLVKTFEPSEKLSDVNFSFYMKLFGEELEFWAVDEQLTSALREGFLGIPQNLMQFLTGRDVLPIDMHLTHFTDGTLRLPTVFGFPFVANLSILLHAQVTGQVQMKRGIFDTEMVHARMHITPTLFSQLSLEAGIDATISKAFMQMKIEAHVPDMKNILMNWMYAKTGPARIRFHVQRPENEWNIAQVKSTRQAVYREVKLNGEWSVYETPLPMKYHMESQQQQTKTFNVEMKPLGLQMRAQLVASSWITLQGVSPIPLLLQGPFQFTATLKNEDTRRDGIELHIISRKAENLDGSIVVQLLRTKFTPTLTDNQLPNTSEHPQTTNIHKHRNPRLSHDQSSNEMTEEQIHTTLESEKALILSELVLRAETIDKQALELTATLTMKKISEQGINVKLTMKALMTPPKRKIQFNPETPLKMEYTQSEENLFTLKCRLLKEENEILKYKMSFDMDEMAQHLFQRMSENIHQYEAMHPTVKQCSEDIKKRFTNSPACFFTWRYMNVLNRWNHTLLIPKSAPASIRRIVFYLLTRKLASISHLLRGIRVIDVDNDEILPMEDEFIRKTDPQDKIYFTSVATSPYDLSTSVINYLFDSTLLRVPRVVLPAMYLTHMNPADPNMYTSLV
jgi:hypothetical protein